jgi:hypothetical protein
VGRREVFVRSQDSRIEQPDTPTQETLDEAGTRCSSTRRAVGRSDLRVPCPKHVEAKTPACPMLHRAEIDLRPTRVITFVEHATDNR